MGVADPQELRNCLNINHEDWDNFAFAVASLLEFDTTIGETMTEVRETAA